MNLGYYYQSDHAGRSATTTNAAACSPWSSTYRHAFIEIPAQIVRTGRQVRWRILAYNPWLGAFFRLIDTL